MEAKPTKVTLYLAETGKCPYEEWFGKLRDPVAKAKVAGRIDKVKDGNYGDCESVGEGVIELRIHYGPGYRVYCLPDGDQLVILLCGGTKKAQQADIKKAKEYAQDYRRR
jgi:putative addiction module killer protein